MLSQTSNFLEDATGIEKTLRLFQGLCTVLAGLADSHTSITWITAKSQINLGRRYLRLHKWHPCFKTAYHHATKNDQPGLEKLLEVGKWSFLGLYFLLEMPTLTNAMGITTYDWATQLQQEALKCWFYGISWSILLSVYQLLTVFFSEPAAVQPVNAKSNEKETSEKQPAARQKPSVTARDPALRSKIYTQLMIDGCDIFLPGAAVGWIPVDQVFVGTCQTISSALAGRQVWDRVQAVA